MNTDNKAQETKEAEKPFLFQGIEDLLENLSENKERVCKIKTILLDLFNVKNLNFLFGAGTSNGAIPTMTTLQEQVEMALNEDEKKIFEKIGKKNLEEILEILYSGKTYLKNNPQDKDNKELEILEGLIEKIKGIIFNAINIKIDFECKDKTKQEVFCNYENFYKKITYRNKDLNRVNVFTTNNDLFNERVLDYLNIDYNNGFGGGLSRSFNPARFEYIFSKKMDEGIEKYEPLNHMIYLYKLHGSINWVGAQGNNSFFNIQEINLDSQNQETYEKYLIYPTPLKEGKSLTSPYTDLIREFQKKLSLPNSVLFIIGYSFSDEHINTIIYRALASNNSLSIVIFADKNKLKEIPLFRINDKRIYVIYGEYEGKKIRYFDYFTQELIPDPKQDDENEINKKFLEMFKEETRKKECSLEK